MSTRLPSNILLERIQKSLFDQAYNRRTYRRLLPTKFENVLISDQQKHIIELKVIVTKSFENLQYHQHKNKLQFSFHVICNLFNLYSGYNCETLDDFSVDRNDKKKVIQKYETKRTIHKNGIYSLRKRRKWASF